MNAVCPECEAKIRLPLSVELWDSVRCSVCGTTLMVINDDPYELDYADDDYDDDDDDFDDDDDRY